MSNSPARLTVLDPAGPPSADRPLSALVEWIIAGAPGEGVAPRTVDNMRCLLGNPALADLMRQPLRETRPIDVQHALRGLSHYTPATQRTFRMVLSGVYRRAVDGGLILANPARGIRGPTIRQPEHTVLAPDQTLHLAAYMLDAKAFHPAYAVIGGMLGCGLRISEARGPKVADLVIDGARPEWRVQWQATRTGADRCDPKSYNGRRAVPMLPVVAALIRRRLEEHPRAATGDDWALGYTLARPVSCPVVNLELRHACKAAGLPVVSAHALRHAYASALAASGASPAALADLLGVTVSVALTYYVHALPGSAWAAVEGAFSAR